MTTLLVFIALSLAACLVLRGSPDDVPGGSGGVPGLGEGSRFSLADDADETEERPDRVDFLIAGTQKGGTTALASFLAQHPDICMAPGKEVHLFDRDAHYFAARSQGFRAYHDLFAGYRNGQVVGEATPSYMFFPAVARRAWEYNPRMKFILLLRNPIERAYSHYVMETRRNREDLPFARAIRAEPRRCLRSRLLRDGQAVIHHTYVSRGMYARQIRDLLKHFPPSRMLVLLTEDLVDRHGETLMHVYDFLGVERVTPPEGEFVFAQDYAPMSPTDRRLLQKRCRREIARLSKMLGRDLSHWT